MKSLKKISQILELKHIESRNKYVVKIEADDQTRDVDFWLSQKQMDGLKKAFSSELESTPAAPAKEVWAVFEQREQYFNFVWPSTDKDWLEKTFMEAASVAQGE